MNAKFFIFAIINFGALALGGFFTGKGVSSEWYANLPKAPWTPPGWVFGFAWTTIMICFSIYMAELWKVGLNKKIILAMFILQWILNVGWNPVFFYYHHVLAGLVLITLLTILMGYMLLHNWPPLQLKSVWILPYFIWLLIATSLNAYILVKN